MAPAVSVRQESSCVGGKIGVKNIMQISKLFTAICGAAFCAGLISTQAQDNPAQSAARAALIEKMNEDAPPTMPPAIVVTPSGATMEKPAPPAIQTPPPAPTLAVTPPTNNAAMGDTDAQKAALLAAEQKAAEADAKTEEQETAQANKAAKLADREAAKQRAAAEKAATTGVAAKNMAFQPMQGPPPPISAAKEAQLQALLAKYEADQISSAEYQTQRAAILAQP
jgi:type IV secretory pathway VirB10-like protein